MTDEELIAAWEGGDESAGDRLARRYYVQLKGFFRTRVPHDEVEELAQQTLLHTVARTQRFRHASSFRHYVFCVARRVLADRHRQLRRSPDSPASTPETPALDTTPSERLSRAEHRQQVQAAIDAIPDPYRKVLLMHLEEVDNYEIASQLGINYNTVRSRLSRAMSALRRRLGLVAREDFGGYCVGSDPTPDC